MFRFAFLSALVVAVVPVSAQEMIYFGEGRILPDQKVDVVCEVNGVMIVCGKAEKESDQPIWICNKNLKKGSIFLQLPKSDSPRGVGFIEGKFPNFKPIDVWVKGEKEASPGFQIPSADSDDYSWRITVSRNEAGLEAKIDPKVLTAAENFVKRAKK